MLYLIAAVLAVAIVALDQLVKYLVVQNIALGEVVPFLDGVVHWTHTHNTGAAFSILSGQRWPLIVMTLIVLVAVIVLLARRIITKPFGVLTLAAIFGGAVGNLIDRIAQGYVVDMIEVEFMNFAVFNVADIFVTCGGIALCFYILFFHEDKVSGQTPEDDHDDTL